MTKKFPHTAIRRWLPYHMAKLHNRFRCFNTQPPEGGCAGSFTRNIKSVLFQHTATRRRLLHAMCQDVANQAVSTHSRPKAAAIVHFADGKLTNVSTHSRTEAAASPLIFNLRRLRVSTHSRTEAAAKNSHYIPIDNISFNTQPHGGGCLHDP